MGVPRKVFFLCKCYPQTSFYCTKTFINVWAVIFYYCPLSLWLGWSQGKFGPLMEAATVHSHKRMKKKNNVFMKLNIYIEILWDLKRCCEGSQKSARQSESRFKNVFESLIRKKTRQGFLSRSEWVLSLFELSKTNDKCQDFELPCITLSGYCVVTPGAFITWTKQESWFGLRQISLAVCSKAIDHDLFIQCQ